VCPKELLYALIGVLSLTVALGVIGRSEPLVDSKGTVSIPHKRTRELGPAVRECVQRESVFREDVPAKDPGSVLYAH
jgi:hypothetical protein